MPISLSCPQCGKLYQLSDGLAGKKGRCKDCGTIFVIPAPRAGARPAAPPPPPADLFAGLDDGEAVARPAGSRPVSTKFGPLPPAEAEPAPPRRVSSKPKRRAEVDRESQEGYRKAGVSIMVFGALAFVLPLVGLQWKVLAAMPPAVQEIGGALIAAIGAAIVGLSFAPRPSRVLRVVAIVVFGLFAVVVVLAIVGHSMGLGRPRIEAPDPAFAAQPNRPAPMPRPFVPPPANPALSPPAKAADVGQADTSEEPLFTLSNAQAARESGPGVMIRELTFRVDYRSTGKQANGPPQFSWVVESARTNASRRMVGVNMQGGTLSGSITVTDGDTGPFKTYLVREAFGAGGRQRAKVSDVVDMQWMGERAANDSMIPTGPAQPPPNIPPTGPRRGLPNMLGRPGFPRRPGMPPN